MKTAFINKFFLRNFNMFVLKKLKMNNLLFWRRYMALKDQQPPFACA